MKELLDKRMVQAIAADHIVQGVIVGASNRSMPGFQETLLSACALMATNDDLVEIVAAVDAPITPLVD